MRKSIIFLSMILLSGTVSCQVISTEAPSQTSSAVVVDKGVFQIESRAQIMENNGKHLIDLPVILFRTGITKRLELRMVSGYSLREIINISGSIRPIELGGKYAILANPESRFKLAVIAHSEIPTPDFDYFKGTATLAFSVVTGNKSSLAMSSIYEYHYSHQGLDIQQILTGTLIYSRQMTKRLSVFAEIYGGVSDNAFSGMHLYGNSINYDTGFYYLLKDHIQLDYTFGLGLNNDMYFHSIGLDIMFHPLKDE